MPLIHEADGKQKMPFLVKVDGGTVDVLQHFDIHKNIFVASERHAHHFQSCILKTHSSSLQY
jgi:hypothetical protein